MFKKIVLGGLIIFLAGLFVTKCDNDGRLVSRNLSTAVD